MSLILEELKQEDYELWVHTQGYSHLSEEQWDWLIQEFKKKKKIIHNLRREEQNGRSK